MIDPDFKSCVSSIDLILGRQSYLPWSRTVSSRGLDFIKDFWLQSVNTKVAYITVAETITFNIKA